MNAKEARAKSDEANKESIELLDSLLDYVNSEASCGETKIRRHFSTRSKSSEINFVIKELESKGFSVELEASSFGTLRITISW